MKKLIILLSLTFISFTSKAQVTNRLFNPQATPSDTNAYNFLWVDTTAGNMNMIWVGRTKSLKIVPKQIKWGVDTMTSLRTTLNTKLAKSDTTGKWKPSAWYPKWSDVSGKPSFSLVSTTGSYNDLSNKPSIPAAQVSSDWNSNTGVSQILNKPVIPQQNTYSAGSGLTKTGTEPNATFSINTTQVMTVATATDSISSIKNSINGKVPMARTISVNGVTQDLSVNRSWMVGDLSSSGSYANPSWITSLAYGKLTSAPTIPSNTSQISESGNLYYTDTRARSSISAGSGLSYNSGTGVLTNSSPDQTVAITAGSGMNVSGTYPNFTLSTTSLSFTYTTPARPINSTAFQVSATKEARVSYSITHTFALTLVLSSGSSMIYLEVSPNGSSGWVTISSAGYSESLAVAVAVNKTVTSNVQGVIPVGYYARLRSIVSGGGTAAYANGQEVY